MILHLAIVAIVVLLALGTEIGRAITGMFCILGIIIVGLASCEQLVCPDNPWGAFESCAEPG